MIEQLSQKEIKFIIQDSQNPEYTIDNLFHPGFSKTDIMKVSNKTGLTLFYGNEDTGFKHIHERHLNMSLKPYWNKKKLEKQSKFENSIIPFCDYLNIADHIYKVENINIIENNNQDNFDLFVGYFPIKSNKEKYRLILYKGTKIIHSLFPTSKDNNLKINTSSFSRGSVSIENNLSNNETNVIVPYKNFKNEISYEILFVFRTEKMVKIVTIRKYIDGKLYNQKEFFKSKYNYNLNPIFLLSFQYKNLKEYESKFSKL